MKCSECRFWLKTTGKSVPKNYDPGECHCREPSPAGLMEQIAAMKAAGRCEEFSHEQLYLQQREWTERLAVWPVTQGDDFCGEFLQNPRERSRSAVW